MAEAKKERAPKMPLYVSRWLHYVMNSRSTVF
jgi:hypothetical protein